MYLVRILATERDSPRAPGPLGRVVLQTALDHREASTALR